MRADSGALTPTEPWQGCYHMHNFQCTREHKKSSTCTAAGRPAEGSLPPGAGAGADANRCRPYPTVVALAMPGAGAGAPAHKQKFFSILKQADCPLYDRENFSKGMHPSDTPIQAATPNIFP